MKVADVMTRGVISLAPDDSVRKAADLMLRYDVSGFPVLDRGRLVGIITEGDFLRRAETGTERRRTRWIEFLAAPDKLADEYAHAHGRKVGEVMTQDLVTIRPNAPLDEAVELMEKHRIKRLLVVENGAIVGVLSRRNLLHAFVAATRFATATKADGPVPLGDAAIQWEVSAELDRQPWLVRGSVETTVENGVVMLEGTVRDDRVHAALLIAVENVPGVKQVVDRLSELDALTPS
jgi:CBS domain-containing protein